MRGLTPFERQVLEEANVPDAPPYDDVSVERISPVWMRAVERLAARGLVSSTRVEDREYYYEVWTTTDRGKLALRCCVVIAGRHRRAS